MITGMLCRSEDTVLSVMKIINANARGTAFVVDENEKLCGVVTDGDIRRSLLNGLDLHENIAKIIKPTFSYGKVGENIDQMLLKVSGTVRIMPIIDENFKVVDYIENKRDVHIPITAPSLSGNEFKYLVDAFLSTWISSKGEYVSRFENNFSKFCQCKYGAAVSNGTVAIHLALLVLGVGAGDEVIVPDLTFAGTINAVLHARATPVIVDIEEDSWCIDPAEIKKAITPKTKAIIPVHLYGQPCDMDAIMNIARAHSLFVVEDCAEAHGARFDGKRVGSFGDIGCFSFYGNKIITTGEGGMCVTNSEELDAKIRTLRDHGMSRSKQYWHDVVGYNYRLTNLQSAIGCAQFERIDEILKSRKAIEDEYRERLYDVNNIQFQRDDLPKREKTTWLVSALVKDGKRNDYISLLKSRRIDVRSFFYPLSEMDIYKGYAFSNKLSHEVSRKGINFPTKFMLDEHIFSEIRDVLKVKNKK